MLREEQEMLTQITTSCAVLDNILGGGNYIDERQSKEIEYKDVPIIRPKLRMLQLVEKEKEKEKEKENALPHGESGDASIQLISFQVLSCQPRAPYCPNFATAEQCQSIIEMAKKRLKPSQLALRQGETAETTKGSGTSSGTFISASEDKTGILDLIEQKIARATMLPQTHGEVDFSPCRGAPIIGSNGSGSFSDQTGLATTLSGPPSAPSAMAGLNMA